MTTQADTYDVIIAGGGPAGCAAAISAKRDCPSAQILLLEKGTYPRHKVCGEFISPEALALLQSLVGLEQSPIASALRISQARLLVRSSALHVSLTPPAISVPRYQLDELLWSAAQRVGVECVSATATQVIQVDKEFHVHAGNGELRARVVINASGRWSNLSGSPAAGKDKWVGLKAHFAEASPPSSVDLYFFQGGYCGVQRVGTEAINACAMVQADVARDLPSTWEQHPALRSRSQGWAPLTETFATAPLRFRPPRATKHGMLLVGDAAGFIDPFLGDGISLALHSGAMAGGAVSEFCTGGTTFESMHTKYEAAYRQEFAPAFRRASGLRRLLAMPAFVRTPVLNLARLPGIAEFVFRSTRSA